MDDRQFDRWTLSLTERLSRRGLGRLGTRTLGALGVALIASAATDAKKKKKGKKKKSKRPTECLLDTCKAGMILDPTTCACVCPAETTPCDTGAELFGTVCCHDNAQYCGPVDIGFGGTHFCLQAVCSSSDIRGIACASDCACYSTTDGTEACVGSYDDSPACTSSDDCPAGDTCANIVIGAGTETPIVEKRCARFCERTPATCRGEDDRCYVTGIPCCDGLRCRGGFCAPCRPADDQCGPSANGAPCCDDLFCTSEFAGGIATCKPCRTFGRRCTFHDPPCCDGFHCVFLGSLIPTCQACGNEGDLCEDIPCCEGLTCTGDGVPSCRSNSSRAAPNTEGQKHQRLRIQKRQQNVSNTSNGSNRQRRGRD